MFNVIKFLLKNEQISINDTKLKDFFHILYIIQDFIKFIKVIYKEPINYKIFLPAFYPNVLLANLPIFVLNDIFFTTPEHSSRRY